MSSADTYWGNSLKCTIALLVIAACFILAETGEAQSQTPYPIHEFIQSHPPTANHVAIIEDGFDAFVLRINLIRSARRTIDIQTFIWADDDCARFLAEELSKAAARGVKVRLLADHMWSTKNPEALAWTLADNGNIQLSIYRPAGARLNPSLQRKIIHFLTPNNSNQRMHNKLFLVDGVIGITGGRNVGDNYFNYSTKYNFKDRDVLLMGPEVEAMSQSFSLYWRFKHTHSRNELKDSSRRLSEDEVPDGNGAPGLDVAFFGTAHRLANDSAHIRTRFLDSAMAVSELEFVADKPGRKTFSYYFSRRGGGNMAAAIRKELIGSRESILIQSPYVILNRRARRILRKVKKRAPDLRAQISTNSFGAADHLETYSANFRLRTKVIRGLDFDVFEYKPHPEDLSLFLANFESLKKRAEDNGIRRAPFLSIHSKSYVFDNQTAFIGTYNLDPRSFYINSECGLFVRDTQFVQDLTRRIHRDMAPTNSWVIAPKRIPLRELNVTLEGLSSLLPIDLWPLRSTSSFELIEGKQALPRHHADFYDNYRDLGSFPGSEGLDADKTLTRMYKRIGKWATPLL